MKRLRFGIRSILILATMVAIFMFIMLERRRYFREHVFITVLDSSTGIQLNQFQYRTWLITQASPPWPEWSDWKKFQGDTPLAFKLPAFCKLHVEAHAGGAMERETMLVLPESSHELTLRIGSLTSIPMMGSVVDDETNEPVAGVVVGLAFDKHLELPPADWITDSNGRFDLAAANPKHAIFAFHPRYQYRFATVADPQPLRLSKGQAVRGRVVDSQTFRPVSDCLVEVMYGTGAPLNQNEQLVGDIGIDDGTAAMLRIISPRRNTTTDSKGEFELFLEPLSMHTQIRFGKEGWEDAFALANSPRLSRIELNHGKYEFAGQVVDDRGTPVRQFCIRTAVNGINGALKYRDYEFTTTDGQFQIFANKKWIKCLVNVDGFAPLSFGVNDLNSSEFQNNNSKRIQMSRGHCVTGVIDRSKSHTKKTQVFLTNLENCHSIRNAGPAATAKGLVGSDKEENDQALRFYRYESNLDSKGRYVFNNLAPGVYALLVVYNDQTASLRPVIVESKDIEIPRVTLPVLGRARGIIKEWNSGNSFSDTTIHDSQIQPFDVYYLNRTGEYWPKAFRTNHLGEFELDHLLTGSLEISAEGNGDSVRWSVTNLPFVISKEAEVTVSLEFAIVCKLEVEEPNDWMVRPCNEKALLRGARESKAWIVPSLERSRNGLQIYEVHGPADLPAGQYTLETRDDQISLSLEIEFQRDRRPVRKRISSRRVTANVSLGQSGAFGVIEATLVKGSHAVATFHLPFDSDSPTICFVDETDIYDVLFHDRKGWALLQNVSFYRESIDFGDIELKAGARLDVNISLQGLDIFPSELSVRHETTGKVFSQTIDATGHLDTSYFFNHLMPGKWSVEVKGRDPIVGKLCLFRRDIVIEGTEPIHLAFRKSK